jgi:hypothetical protein
MAPPRKRPKARKRKAKDPAALALGLKRWKGSTQAQRTAAARKAANARWSAGAPVPRKRRPKRPRPSA